MKLVFAILTMAMGLDAAHPIVGRWNLNFEKSTNPGGQISSFAREGEFFTNKNTNGVQYKFKFDGKEYPGAAPTFDTASWRPTGPRKFEHTTRKNGKIVYTVETEVAPDGKTRAYRNTAHREDGTKVVFETVQDRVGGTVDPQAPLVGDWRQRQTVVWSESGGKYTRRLGTLVTTAAMDGKDHPVTGSPAIDTWSVRAVDERTVEVIVKKAGKALSTTQATVSADGKTMTVKTQSRTLVHDRVK